MLRINDDNKVDAREIYDFIGVKSRFNDWFKNSIDFIGAKEGKDFLIIQSESTGGRPRINYIVTIDFAQLLCSICFRSSKKASELYKYLKSLSGVDVVIQASTRKELLFEINLNEILQGITKIIPQYSVLGYRIDFYLPDLNIAIEYDELAHKNYKNDNKRQTDIENYLQCDFIRIKEGFELTGLNQIYKVVLYNILIDLWQKDKLNEDQIGVLERLGMEVPKIINCKSMASKMKLGNIIWDDTKENPLKINKSETSELKKNYNNAKTFL